MQAWITAALSRARRMPRLEAMLRREASRPAIDEEGIKAALQAYQGRRDAERKD